MTSEAPAKPSVLFVCIHNAGRSQMAAAYLTHLSGGAVEVRSAGSAPGAHVNPSAVAAMLEEGIDMSAETPKILTTDAVVDPSSLGEMLRRATSLTFDRVDSDGAAPTAADALIAVHPGLVRSTLAWLEGAPPLRRKRHAVACLRDRLERDGPGQDDVTR